MQICYYLEKKKKVISSFGDVYDHCIERCNQLCNHMSLNTLVCQEM